MAENRSRPADLFPDSGAPPGVIAVNEYRRATDEGRTLVQSALNWPASMELAGDELRVTLAPLSSAHRSKAIAAVCAELNKRLTHFPGTRLQLRYAVEGTI